MGTWYIAPKNEAANRTVAILDPEAVFSERKCFDIAGGEQAVNMALISERRLEHVENDKKSLGLAYDTYFQKEEGGRIERKDFGLHLFERARNKVSGIDRLSDPFKKGRRARAKAGLPKVFRASALLRS